MKSHEVHEKHEMVAAKGELLVYQAGDGQIKMDVRLQDETVWLTQPLLARLFRTTQLIVRRLPALSSQAAANGKYPDFHHPMACHIGEKDAFF